MDLDLAAEREFFEKCVGFLSIEQNRNLLEACAKMFMGIVFNLNHYV